MSADARLGVVAAFTDHGGASFFPPASGSPCAVRHRSATASGWWTPRAAPWTPRGRSHGEKWRACATTTASSASDYAAMDLARVGERTFGPALAAWADGVKVRGRTPFVAVDWDTTRVLAGSIGDYVVVARKEPDADRWFVGAISDEEARRFDVSLSFLAPGRRYVAEIYADGPGAHWLSNPLPVTISTRSVDASTRLRVVLAPGGGQAIRIRPAVTAPRVPRQPPTRDTTTPP